MFKDNNKNTFTNIHNSHDSRGRETELLSTTSTRFGAIQHVLLNFQKLPLGGALAGIDIIHGSIMSIIIAPNS